MTTISKESLLAAFKEYAWDGAFTDEDESADTYNALYKLVESAPSCNEAKGEYICKCGLRVVPHRCQTGQDF